VPDSFLQLPRIDHAGAQLRGQGQARGVEHAGQDAPAQGVLVHPLHDSLRIVPVHHRRRESPPAGMALQEELEWKRGNVKTGQEVHGRSPHGTRRGRGACP
jgi:hypothetical protein